MALLSNVPTLSYIRWQNLLITYQGTTYQITNNQTNKAYIYWDVGNPTELIASSRKLEEKSGQFYIFFNERGRYTVVPNDEIEINFSEGGAREAMTDTIIGFGQKIDANTQRFSTIEADIDGLKTTVGEIQNNGSGGSSSTISKIEQKVDEIELEVEHIERSFNEEQSMNNLRNNVSSSILSLQSTLGQFSSDMNTIMSDNKLSSEEKIQISSYTSSLSSSLSSVTSQIDTVTSHFQEQGDTEKVTRLTTAKNNLTNAVQNLTNGINVASTDNIFTNSEITTIISYFGKANTSINEAKNLIDDYILLGVGGDLVEEISRITLRQDEINLNVSRNEQTVSEDLSNLKQRVNEAELKITDDAIISTVSSTFYSKTEMDDILENYDGGEGGVTFAVNNVDVMYYLSDSATELSGGSWNTTAPTWQNGKYIWSKTITTFTDGSTKETTPVCITGAKGEDGMDGVPGKDGEDGVVYYTWIRYADSSNGEGISNSPDGKEYIGFAYNKTTPTESNTPSDYKWSLIKGTDGVDGKDGTPYYTWIKYSDNENGSNMYDTPNDNTKYIGIATNKITQTESNIVSDYKWSKFKGDDGVDGATYYTWIKYADDKNGNGMSNDPTGKLYIGFAYNKTTSTESNVASDYKWSLIKGTDGVDGEKGEDGTTYYTWIKYSDNSDGSNMYETPNNNTKYIGIAVNKTTPTESSNKSDYTWSKFRGENGVDGRSITSITEEYYLSTSKTTQTGGSWVTTPPTWEKGKYMWTRSKIVYDNPYGVEYTTPICDSSWDITNDLNIEIETTKKTVAQHSVELESITSKVQTNSSTILRIDGEIDSVETRVSSAEQKITDEAIINTVTSSSNWIESVGGVNLIPNSTAKYDLEGWLSMNNNNITRYENNQIYYNNEGGTGVNISGSVNGDLVENVSTLSYSYLHVLEPRGGGGLALLIQDKSGQTIMIDGGYEANASHCISYLNSLGIKKLDYYIISHAHSDHIEGAIDILEYFNAKKVIIKRLDTSKLPSVEFEWRTDTLYNEFMNMCTKKGVEVIDASSYNHIKISNDSYIKIYNTGNLDWTNYNSQSLMLLYVYKNNKVFLACDGTHNASNSAIGLIGKVDIFQAGHHGDGTEGGSSQKLIDELQPTHTIFASDWLANDIDQTKEGETLNRVSYYGGLSYSHGTGHNGDYVFTLNGTTVSTSAISTKAQSCWHLRDGNKWYWFKSNGVLAKNEVVTISSKNYRFKADGVAYCDEWYQDSSDNYYYYDPSCAMAINSWWQDKYGNWFYLQSGGVMAVNKTLTISSKEYRFKADGIAYCNEWYQNTSTKYWYFYGEDCAMFKNAWRENKFGEWYWLKSNGVMAVSETLTINGVSRTFNDQGVCINPN